jgi:hypothetical protein
MKTRILAFFLLALCPLTAGAQTADRAAALQVGAASETVNPPLGILLGGCDRNRKSTGIHDDLSARAIVFYDGVTAVALVPVDNFSIPYDITETIREAASKAVTKIKLPPANIIVQATHTHAAPDNTGLYGPTETESGRSAAYVAQLCESATKAVTRAVEALQPAKLVWATTRCGDWLTNDSEKDIIDDSVTILQCTDLKGKTIATLTNFACHPTVLAEDNALISADWVAGFYRTMAQQPGQHLFLQGAIGCWMQPKDFDRTFDQAEQCGKDLGEKVMAALKQAKPVKGNQVRFANRVFDMPIANEMFRALSASGILPRKIAETAPTEVAWFSVGDAQFATHPGETAPEFAQQTKKRMTTDPKFVLGLALDHLGYICPSRYFTDTAAIRNAKYLVEMSPGPEAAPAMMTALGSIIPSK